MNKLYVVQSMDSFWTGETWGRLENAKVYTQSHVDAISDSEIPVRGYFVPLPSCLILEENE